MDKALAADASKRYNALASRVRTPSFGNRASPPRCLHDAAFGNYGEWSGMGDQVAAARSPVEALAAFHRYQQRRGYAASTRRAYDQFLEQFVVWAGGVGLDLVDAQRIEFDWMDIW